MTKAALEKAVQTAADNAQKPNIGWGALMDKALGAAQALSQWTPDALTRAARAVLKK